jgi:hypothetical protein
MAGMEGSMNAILTDDAQLNTPIICKLSPVVLDAQQAYQWKELCPILVASTFLEQCLVSNA